MPDAVRELGLRSEPNLELLKFLGPDLILTETGAEVGGPLLERIAPVESFVPLKPGRKPAEVAREATLALAARLVDADGLRIRPDHALQRRGNWLAGPDTALLPLDYG